MGWEKYFTILSQAGIGFVFLFVAAVGISVMIDKFRGKGD